MANAKTYNELNQASAVNASDKVALAQENKTELVTTTVSDLANAVGELNQAGALAELSLATSIGKNLLAQRLNEKGVPTDPSETLVQMADKVCALVTSDAMTFNRGRLAISTDNNLTLDIASVSMQCIYMPNNYMLIVTNSTMYLVPKGDYESLQQMVASSVSSVDVKTPYSNYSHAGRSKDGKTIVYSADTNDSFELYDVDWSGNTPVLSYIKSVTAPHTPYSNQNWTAGITDDRELIAYISSRSSNCELFLTNDTSVWTTFNAGYTYDVGQIYIVTDEQKQGTIYTATSYRVGYNTNVQAYRCAGLKYTPTAESATGSITAPTAIAEVATSVVDNPVANSAYIDFDLGLLFRHYTKHPSTYSSSKKDSMVLSIYNLINTEINEAITPLTVYAYVLNPTMGDVYRGISQVSNSSIKNTQPLGLYGFPITKLSGTTYRLDIPMFEDDNIVYDISAGTITRGKQSIALLLTDYIRESQQILFKHNNTYTYLHNDYTQYYGTTECTDKAYITMISLNYNNTPIDIPITALKYSDIEGLSPETTTVPLPESETQEA